MNLKAAARRLEMHYQTAYRLVRSGELIAIKVGAGYEISEAAIERYLAGRQAIAATTQTELDHISSTPARSAPAHGSHGSYGSVTDELTALMGITTLSTRPVLDLVTQHLAETIGDFAVLRLLSEDRRWLVGASSNHHDPERRAIIAAVLSQPQTVESAVEQITIKEGRVHRIDFLRVDVARHLIPPAFQQYADRMTVYSLLTVPVLSDHGRVLGQLTMARDLPGRPYTAAEEATITEMARWASAAIGRVDRFTAGWNARQTLHDRVEALLADQRDINTDELTDLLMALFDETVPEAVFDLDRNLVACNDPFAHRLGLDALAPPYAPFTEHTAAACVVAADVELWDRLISGDTDYLDQMAEGCAVGCPIADGVHWAVARRPDATPAFVIATCSSGPRQPGGDGGEQCWTICQARPAATIRP